MLRILSLGKTPEEHVRQLLTSTWQMRQEKGDVVFDFYPVNIRQEEERRGDPTFFTVTLRVDKRWAWAKDKPVFRTRILPMVA